MPFFTLSEDGGVLTITLNNPFELNDFRSSTFRDALYEAVRDHDHPRVVLDIGASDYLSSSGVTTLVGLKRRVEAQNGTLVLTHVHAVVLNLLRVMKLTQYFTIED